MPRGIEPTNPILFGDQITVLTRSPTPPPPLPSPPSPPYHVVDSGWSEARGGGSAAPLLTTFDLSGYGIMMSWQLLVSMRRL